MDILRCEEPETLLAVALSEDLPVEVVLDVVARGLLTHPLFLEVVAGHDSTSTRARCARDACHAAAFGQLEEQAAAIYSAWTVELTRAVPRASVCVVVAITSLANARARGVQPDQALFLAHRAIAELVPSTGRLARAAHRRWTAALCSSLRDAITGWVRLHRSAAAPC